MEIRFEPTNYFPVCFPIWFILPVFISVFIKIIRWYKTYSFLLYWVTHVNLKNWRWCWDCCFCVAVAWHRHVITRLCHVVSYTSVWKCSLSLFTAATMHKSVSHLGLDWSHRWKGRGSMDLQQLDPPWKRPHPTSLLTRITTLQPTMPTLALHP